MLRRNVSCSGFGINAYLCLIRALYKSAGSIFGSWGLQGPATQMADEMERVYRGQIKVYSQDFADRQVDAKGLLKARLFGVSFIVVAFGMKSGSNDHLPAMMNASSGLAMLPFSSPSYVPKISRDTAASFAGEYMMRVVKNITLELKQDPSTPMNPSVGFSGLVSCYEEALAESIGAGSLTPQVKERFYPMIAGAVNANLGFMHQCIQA